MSGQEKGLVLLITKPGSNVNSLKQGLLVEGFNPVFAESYSKADELLEELKPVIVLHEIGESIGKDAKQFEMGLAKKTIPWDMSRAIMVEKILPEVGGLANDARVDKVFSRKTSVLAIASELKMMVNSLKNLSSVQKEIRNMRLNKDRMSQDEIDNKIEKAYQDYGHDSEVKIEYANLSLRKEKVDEAEKVTEALLSSEEQQVRALNLLPRIKLKKGDMETAIALLEKADILSPENVDRLVEMGKVFHKTGDLGRAKDCFKSALDIDDGNTDANSNLGEIYLSEGHLDDAISLFKDKLSEEETASTFNNLAVAAVQNGDFAKGMKLYESAFKCLESNKYKARVLFNLALAQKKSGDFTSAHATLLEVVELDGSFQKAKSHLTDLAKKLKESDDYIEEEC